MGIFKRIICINFYHILLHLPPIHPLHTLPSLPPPIIMPNKSLVKHPSPL
ncbi:hypothetical protein NBO_198g0001 [Nosema bombycis CQ1]|uniref:Uncharacterized protein n=1 Tax=Nosema bombycis (strain CQ1 / CVCC 102059) TaxID=578461 RepID=R0KS94_NOSB1|nr:hypothetical protein NBO_198g0001 [Nosema bombycis CQ1]|eukprot:EOB13087.1 hypothetical protein NBO_198g0001 [Nosema bombycis CQ1]